MVATFLGQQGRCASGSKGASERPVRALVIRLAERRQSPAGQRLQTRRVHRLGDTVRRRPDFGNDLAAIGDEDALTTANLAKVFTEAILEFPNTNSLHAPNVAS